MAKAEESCHKDIFTLVEFFYLRSNAGNFPGELMAHDKICSGRLA